jgi:ElaB/YqjD/DUF883 family membrane-anchored ribosome-binding protein
MSLEQGGDAAGKGPEDRTLQDDVDKLRADIASLRDSLARVVTGVAGEATKTVQGAAQGAAAQTGATAHNLADSGLNLAASAKEQAIGFAGELEAMARRNPLGTIGGAVLVGFVLGMMSRGRG